MLQLAAIVLVGISAALSGFIITDSIAPQRTPAETAVAAVASVDLPEPTTVTNLPVFDPVEFEAVPGAGFPTAAPVQQPVAVIPSPVADTSLVQALAATVTTLAAQFGALEKLEGRLSGLEARPVSSLSPAVSGGGAAAPVYVNTHGLTQKIDRLENTTITNATISGGSVTATSILGTIANVIDSAVASIDSLTADTLVATNAAFTNSTTTNATTTNHYISNLMAAAANVTGDLTVSGTITGGTLSVSGLSSGGAVEAPYFTATSTTATSTFAGGLTAGTNGLTVLQNGNVGIGTTTPTEMLTIGGGSQWGVQMAVSDGIYVNPNSGGAQITAESAGGVEGGILSYDTTGIVYMGSWSNNDVRIRTNNADRLTIDTSGNVGIGTTTPQAKLHVEGTNVLFNNTVGSTFTVRSSVANGNDYEMVFEKARGGATPSVITSADDIGSIRFKGYDGTNYVEGAGILADTSGTIGTGSIGGTLNLTTNGSSRLFIDADGDVGIGTTAPNAKLEVNGTVRLGGTAANATTDYYSTAGSLRGSLWTDGTDFTLASAGASAGLILRTNATNRVKIDSSGNVGIGDTTPASLLTVGNGDLFQVNSSGAIAASTGITTSGQLNLSGTSANIALGSNYLSGDGGDEGVYVDASGNVGIGTSAPTQKLHIANAGGSTAIRIGNDATGKTYGWLGTSADTNGYFSINSIKSQGSLSGNIILNAVNVGIGTTTPSHTLSVAGTVGFDGLTGATGAGSLCLDASKQVVYNAGSDACLPSLRDTKHDILALSLSGIDTIEKLEPVSFVYNEGDGRVRLGFIAENTAAVHSELATYNAAGAISGIDDRAVLSVVVKAIKEMWAHVTGQDQRITTHDTEIAALNVRIANLEVQLGAASAAVPTASTATIELLINGNNPALIAAGESYVDLGATASSSDTTLLALGIRTFVDGTAVETVVVDTSIAATTTITYRIIDGDGAVLAEAERTVVVSDPAQSELPAEQTTDEPIEPMSNN